LRQIPAFQLGVEPATAGLDAIDLPLVEWKSHEHPSITLVNEVHSSGVAKSVSLPVHTLERLGCKIKCEREYGGL
jgi:hypothetical protein